MDEGKVPAEFHVVVDERVRGGIWFLGRYLEDSRVDTASREVVIKDEELVSGICRSAVLDNGD